MAKAEHVARGTVLSIAAQAWQLVTAFLLYHFIASILGAARFGHWRVTLSILNYFELLLYTGIVQVAAKRLAEAPDEAPVIERASYLGQMLFAGGLFIAAELSAGLIATTLREPALKPLIRIAALDIPLVAAFMIASYIRLGRVSFTRQAFGMWVYATAKFVAIAFLVWRGFSVPGALIGNALSSLVGFVVVFKPWEGTAVKFREIWAEARTMGIAAVPFLVQSAVAGVSSDADLWFVQALEGSVAAGLYSGAVVLAEIPTFLFGGLSRVLFPSVVSAGARKNEALVARYATQGIRLALLVTVLGIAVIAATGGAALVMVFTPEFAAAAVPFTILMVASVGRNVRAISTDVMMARGQRRQALLIVTGTTFLELALLAVLTTTHGQVGAAVAAAVAAIVAGAAGAWTLRSLLGIRVVWTILRAGLAAAIVGVGLALTHPTGLWLLPAYLVAGTVYILLLLLMREIDAHDIASIRAAVVR